MGSEQEFDGRRFLQVAEFLRPEFSDEAFARAAIGRCYYATFLPALELLVNRGIVQKSGWGQDHGAVRGNYGAIDRHGRKDFQRLHEWRRAADYETVWPSTADAATTAHKAIEIATKLLENQTTGWK